MQDGITAPVAGWYPDPWGHHARRYWTGQGWTDQVWDRPAPQVPQVQAPRYLADYKSFTMAQKVRAGVGGLLAIAVIVLAAGPVQSARNATREPSVPVAESPSSSTPTDWRTANTESSVERVTRYAIEGNRDGTTDALMGELDSVLSSPDSYDPAYVGEVRLVLVMVQADGASSAAQQFAEWLVTNYPTAVEEGRRNA